MTSAVAESPTWAKRLLTLAIAALVAVIAASLLSARGEVTRGVSILGIPVGGLSLAEARARIADRTEELHREEVELRLGDVTWAPTLADLGVSYDAERAYGMAAGVGRGRDRLTGLLRGLHLVSSPMAVDVPASVDTERLRAWCQARLAELELAPVDARLTVDGSLVSISPDASGVAVSVDRLAADLLRELAGFTNPSVELITLPRPAAVRAADLEPQLRAMDATFSRPLALVDGADQWLVAPSELADTLEITMGDAGGRLTFDEEGIDELTAQLAREIDQRATDAYVSRDGTHDRLVPARTGRRVDRSLLDTRIHEALSGGAHEVEIPVEESGGIETTDDLLAELGVTHQLATGDSDLTGSNDRRLTNIRVAAELVDGILLGPGDTFSFNRAIGEIAGNPGFVAAGVTEAGIPGTAVGGGVCQVSTSVFRAALIAGLPLVEWWSHGVRSLSYEQGGWTPGFDAAVQQPELDLRFENVTDGHILIRAEITGSTLSVTLSGAAPETSVEVLDPLYLDIVSSDLAATEEIDPSLPEGTVEEWQPARDGVTMVVVRRVYDDASGELVSEDEFVSIYAPQGPVYRVSPDQAGAVIWGE